MIPIPKRILKTRKPQFPPVRNLKLFKRRAALGFQCQEISNVSLKPKTLSNIALPLRVFLFESEPSNPTFPTAPPFHSLENAPFHKFLAYRRKPTGPVTSVNRKCRGSKRGCNFFFLQKPSIRLSMGIRRKFRSGFQRGLGGKVQTTESRVILRALRTRF